MRYRIALHKSEEGYSVSVPGLPGCWSQGATEKEALDNIRDAISEYISVAILIGTEVTVNRCSATTAALSNGV